MVIVLVVIVEAATASSIVAVPVVVAVAYLEIRKYKRGNATKESGRKRGKKAESPTTLKAKPCAD